MQIKLLRAAGLARRLQIALSLSSAMMALAREGIRQALGPGATDAGPMTGNGDRRRGDGDIRDGDILR